MSRWVVDRLVLSAGSASSSRSSLIAEVDRGVQAVSGQGDMQDLAAAADPDDVATYLDGAGPAGAVAANTCAGCGLSRRHEAVVLLLGECGSSSVQVGQRPHRRGGRHAGEAAPPIARPDGPEREVRLLVDHCESLCCRTHLRSVTSRLHHSGEPCRCLKEELRTVTASTKEAVLTTTVVANYDSGTSSTIAKFRYPWRLWVSSAPPRAKQARRYL
jgi:hypothetical protein